ncbi:hybrid sensor histidine kinase/response regulator [Myxococcus xanthus]|uniref:histidine kinase n=1 Tax=Myxococcus xanthus TaxID=34 RepID=A0AAE6FVE6_MYXXA|nr:hybrid sensor histidine kinase/response regulator [Myxococcus xanthus]QDE73082.1 hybrid sensor histidine kinase/response regulator [Myxococcus xanthus]
MLEPRPPVPLSPRAAHSPPVVWVLDDSPVETQAICRALEPCCKVTGFMDGASLLECLTQGPVPEVLVLDWHLPDMSGLEVCRFVRGNPATEHVPVLLITGNTRAEDVVEGLAAGANDYVFKPFRPVEFAARVQALAQWERSRRKTLEDERARRRRLEGTLTEVQAAEERAWRSELRFRLAARATRDAVWEWDPRTGLTDWTSSLHEVFGYAPGTIQDEHRWWEERLHPDDRARVVASLQATLEGPEHEWQDTYRFQRGDGSWAYVADRCHIIRDAQDKATQVVGAMQDVTERQEAEAARARLLELERGAREESDRQRAMLATLFEQVPALLGVLSVPDQRCVVANARLRQRFGQRPLVGRTLREALPELEGQNVLELLDTVFATGESFSARELPVRIAQVPGGPPPEGYFDFMYQPMLDASGRLTAVILFAVEVTDSVLARRKESELAQQMKARADFERQLIGIVSHDLRNPLGAITLAVAMMLQRGPLDERQERQAQRIRSSADRATRMIRDLLDFTRARQGTGLPVYPQPMDLHEVVRTVLDEVHAGWPDRRLETECTGSGAGTWDPDRLAQLIGNLVGNALQYSPPGTPVRVASRGDDDGVVLEVHNLGPAIPLERQPRIFEPLERATVRPEDQGRRSIGLGLYIVRSIVLAHGGTVEAHSQEETGTTFTVRLPRHAPTALPVRPDGNEAAG